MTQNNTSQNEGRKYWSTTRERERRHARHQIRERVLTGYQSNSIDHHETYDAIENNLELGINLDQRNGSLTIQKSHSPSNGEDAIIYQILNYILKGDRSKFSTTFIVRQFEILSSFLDIKYILENPSILEQTMDVVCKRFGQERVLLLSKYISTLSTFTIYEFSCWCGKYSIVSALLYGGINPCIRSQHLDTHNKSHCNTNTARQMAETGALVLRRFFDVFPIRLSTYIIKRVMDMRMEMGLTWYEQNNNGHNEELFCCQKCDNNTPLSYLLQFIPCEHVFCEICFWDDILSTVDSPEKLRCEDVVGCPICLETETGRNTSVSYFEMLLLHLSIEERQQEMLRRLRDIPVDQRALKSSSKKKKKVTEGDHLSKSWYAAVLPSLGSSQDIRRDKFFSYVERNAIPYVHGCLVSGVDVNWTNEYGQNALYISVWRGQRDLVELLLEYGADPNVIANGGSTLDSVCAVQNDSKIIDLINGYRSTCLVACYSENTSLLTLEKLAKIERLCADSENISFTMLIPENLSHPGCGSFMIDHAISTDTVDALLRLFDSLPVDQNQKPEKSTALCSERSYCCDSEGFIRKILEYALQITNLLQNSCPKNAFSDTGASSTTFRVFPHMRFLNYNRPGTILAPHVDLCRVDPFFSEQRSTHTFILYLTECRSGGETRLLQSVSGEGREISLACVSPRIGRLLIFPHICPHEGMEVVDAPKLILRGECFIRKS